MLKNTNDMTPQQRHAEFLARFNAVIDYPRGERVRQFAEWLCSTEAVIRVRSMRDSNRVIGARDLELLRLKMQQAGVRIPGE